MTRFDEQSERPDCGADVAAYVLGALEPHEADALRAHIATCAVCRDELASLQGVADSLPLAAPQLALPRGLKRRMMSEVRKDARSRSGGRRRLLARPAPAFGGALAVVAAATIAVLLATSGSSGTRLVQARVMASGATASVRLSGGKATLIVHQMPQPPAGKIYEVWLERRGAPPAPTDALFGVTAGGSAAVAVPGDLRGVSEVLVTPERRGGSSVPTHAPVIVAQL